MKKKKIIFLLLVITFSLVITACELGYDTVTDTSKTNSVEYIIYENSEISLPLTSFNSLNPLYTENISFFYFSQLIYDSLFEYDDNLEPIPNLVSSYIIGENGKNIELTLKEGIKFHNGKTLSSKDVIFTINMMKKTGENSYYNKLSKVGFFPSNQITVVKEISENRLLITFKEPLAYMLDVLTFPIIPENSVTSALDFDNYIPIGTGPYKYIKHNKYKEIYLRANEDYREGEPEISHIVGKVFQDEESILTAFETGKLNITKTSGIDWNKYESNKRITIYEYVSNDYIALAFNHEKEIFSTDAAKELKKAILYGIDRSSIIEKIYLKHATQTSTPINPISYLLSDKTINYGYNKDEAIEILNEAGYSNFNTNGIREDLLGNDLDFKLLVAINNNLELKAIEMARDNLKEIGISLNIIKYSADPLEIEKLQKNLDDGDYDIVLIGWRQSIIPRYHYILNSQSALTSNYSFYKNDDMDVLLNKLDISPNKEDKMKLIEDFHDLFVEELPYGSLYFKNNALLVDSFIEGPLKPNFYNIYNGLEKCYIKMSIK